MSESVFLLTVAFFMILIAIPVEIEMHREPLFGGDE